MKINMLKIYTPIIVALLFVLFQYGCTDNKGEENTIQAEVENNSVSIWTDATELFMEYPQLAAGTENKFLIHLTNIKDFSAITSGKLTVTFETNGKQIINQVEEKPLREGIYTPVFTFPNAGMYKMKIKLESLQASDEITVDNISVFSNSSEFPKTKNEGSAAFPFLKEQQWKIEFATEPVTRRTVQNSTAVTGAILPLLQNYVKVTSPFEGIINVTKNKSMPSIGAFVKKGQTLLAVSPSADASTNFLAMKKDFIMAEAEYNRAKGLFEKKAIPQKRLDEALLDYESKKASFDAVTSEINYSNENFVLIAPIDGYVEKINFSLGDKIISGQELFVISNPTRMMLRVDVPETQIGSAINAENASFIIDGLDREFGLKELRGRKISVGSSVDLVSHTIPVYFEFGNYQNMIKIGMHARVFLKVGNMKDAVVVPKSAIIDEDGLKTVYVQIEGESFEKRIVKAGIEDNGYVEILSGIKEGERVVIKGAYQVRLASIAPDSKIGEAHVH